ncbi:MAG: DUF1176 domain-containing protein [Phreatobacter sp.]|uniref:DUF1176 domain-containing protein n=1 Tax=Phreatobacter sp. TaxID=1966341 RepID=UPI002733DF64|nr:DUF1176 domain-containing protein [Phreatobacter sp.]MDP2800714.1 DUF1176 domain-containing protein [Phreatobacter sp.]
MSVYQAESPVIGRGARRAALALGLAMASVVSFPALAQSSGHPPPLMSFGSWTAFCDNTGGCGLANVSMRREPGASDPDQTQAWVCAWLGAEGDADARLSIILEPPGRTPAAPPAIILEVGPSLLGTARTGDDDRHEITGADVPHVARRLGAESRLDLREPDGGPVLGRVSLAGFRRALGYAELRRAVAPPVHEIVPRSFQPVERRAPASLAALHSTWCSGAPWEPASARSYRLFDGSYLWTAGCRRSAYNPLTLVAIEAGDGSTRELQLPSVVDDDMVGPGFTNLALDPARGRLEDLFKTRGANDCGTRRAWVWDGVRFSLVSEHTMPNCFGAGHGQWLRVSVTPVRGEPPSSRRPC